MIDLRRLRVLRAVAHHGTVTAAAEALFVTPSAASQQLRHLGHELGAPLLEPHGRTVRLTAAARVVLGHADAIEERWQRAEADLAGAVTVAGELRLCGGPTAIATLLAPVAARLPHRFPDLRVTVREAEPPECYDLVFSGAADLAVTMAAPDGPAHTDPRFDQQRLLDDRYDLLTSPDHPLAGRPDLTLGECAAEPWILAMPGTTYRQMVLAVCTAAGFTPAVAHEALEWTAVATLVGHGLGVSLVHGTARVPDDPPVVRTPLRGTPRRRVLTVTRRGGRDAPALAAACAELDTVAAGYDEPVPAIVADPRTTSPSGSGR